eukprot:6440846-Prymnesium_polylepis.1
MANAHWLAHADTRSLPGRRPRVFHRRGGNERLSRASAPPRHSRAACSGDCARHVASPPIVTWPPHRHVASFESSRSPPPHRRMASASS